MNAQPHTSALSVTIILWALVGLTLAALPIVLISHGYLPPDDALRHAAKAISGKSWPEILVMRPDITIDHNPGWHWVLSWLHRLANWEGKMLVFFSVATMFLAFAAAPLPWMKRPETWLGSLAVVMLVFPYFAERVFVGRPLLLTIGASLVLLSLWTRPEEREPSRRTLLITIVVLTLSVWVHGSWYLLVLLPTAFFLAGARRKGLLLLAVWAAGSIFGALLTAAPWEFLSQTLYIPFLAFGQNAPVDSLVGEFQPFTGGYPAAIVVGAILVWRKLAGRRLSLVWRDPVFWLAVMGWLLGIGVVRFWLDWGLPALALWLARQFQELVPIPETSWKRVALGSVASLVLIVGVGNDRGGRWSQYGQWESLDANRPEHAAWLPEPGGILYAVNLSVFYETFFTNPRGSWRYVLGFEPALMRPEDLAVYQELWASLNAIRACAPWVQKMRPADRLVLVSGPRPEPAIRQLEWYYAAENTWVGRLPR